MSTPGWLVRLRAMVPTRAELEANPSLRFMAPYLADHKLWHWSRRGVATGLAIGLFIGVAIPIAQFLFAAIAAAVVRANIPIAAAGTLVTNPLTVPPIYFIAYHVGAWATGTPMPEALSFSDPGQIWASLGTIGVPLFVGLMICATLTAAVSYLLVHQVWAWRVATKRRLSRS